MSPDVVTGNALKEGSDRRGWFIGHFIDPTDHLRSTSALEVKWGLHAPGESRSEWSVNQTATTLSILIKGRFRIQFPDRDCLLIQEGDYALWLPGIPHSWCAEVASSVLTIRYPSLNRDNIEIGKEGCK